MSKCSVQELQTTTKRLQIATLLACFEAGGSDTILTCLPHRSPASLPDHLKAMCKCVCVCVCVVSQVAAEPDLAPLLSELVDNSDGQEIYLRRPERYGLSSSTPTSFAHVSLPTFTQCMLPKCLLA